MHATGSRNRLTEHQLDLYPGDTLFARLARTVCGVGVLPRKELHEAWEVARRVRRRFRGGRVVDLCCGHGLLAQVMLLLDETSTEALAVDLRLSGNHQRLSDALTATWPKLAGRVTFSQMRLQDVELRPDDVVHDDASPIQARVLHKAFRGAEFLYTLELASGERVLSLVPSHHDHVLGEPIGIRLDVDHVVAFSAAPERQPA